MKYSSRFNYNTYSSSYSVTGNNVERNEIMYKENQMFFQNCLKKSVWMMSFPTVPRWLTNIENIYSQRTKAP